MTFEGPLCPKGPCSLMCNEATPCSPVPHTFPSTEFPGCANCQTGPLSYVGEIKMQSKSSAPPGSQIALAPMCPWLGGSLGRGRNGQTARQGAKKDQLNDGIDLHVQLRETLQKSTSTIVNSVFNSPDYYHMCTAYLGTPQRLDMMFCRDCQGPGTNRMPTCRACTPYCTPEHLSVP